MAKKSKMNAKQFGLWIEDQAGAQCRQGKCRTDCVINIDHIEPHHFAALYAVDSPTGLLVVELAGHFRQRSCSLAGPPG